MIPYMVGKLAPNLSHLTRGLVRYVPGRDYFCAVPFQNGEKIVTPPPAPQSSNGSVIKVGVAARLEINKHFSDIHLERLKELRDPDGSSL